MMLDKIQWHISNLSGVERLIMALGVIALSIIALVFVLLAIAAAMWIYAIIEEAVTRRRDRKNGGA